MSPIAAMSSEAVGSVGYGSLSRIVVGCILLAAGLVATLTGLFADLPNEALLIGLGCFAVFLGVYVLGRTISLPLSRVIGAPLPRLRGLPGELARENAMRNPKRTAAAGTALMLGVGIVVIINIFVASTKATVNQSIDRAFTADLVIDSGASTNGGLDPSLAAKVGSYPGAPPPTAATRTSASRAWSASVTTCWSANGLTASRWRRSSPAAHPLSGTGRASCSSVSCSLVLPGSGSCTPDPHPGNFRLLADGRLGVLDFGAVDRLPDGFPARLRHGAEAHARRRRSREA